MAAIADESSALRWWLLVTSAVALAALACYFIVRAFHSRPTPRGPGQACPLYSVPFDAGALIIKEETIDPFFLAEFCCWTMVVLAPILTWVNGPAVSTDQFVVRTAVFALALTGGVFLRVTNIVRKGAKKRQ